MANEAQHESREVSSPEAISVSPQDEPTVVSASTVDTNVASSSNTASQADIINVHVQALSQADIINSENQAATLIQTAFRAFLVFDWSNSFSQNDLFCTFR